MHALRNTIRLILVAVMILIFIGGYDTKIVKARTSHGFLNFERGKDGVKIGSTIPGITFTSDRGTGWIYGDVRTQHYNAPYPESCLNRPSGIAQATCDYTVSGNVFAWISFLGGSGRISFTRGTASFVAAKIATGTDLTVVAYTIDNQPIAVQTLLAQETQGQFDDLNLVAPESQSISYIKLTGAGSFWLIDDIETDAPGVPDQRSSNDHSDSAFVTVAQHASPNVI